MAADEKLSEAMTELVREEIARATGGPPPNPAKPRKRDVLIFVVFAASLALLVWSLPSEFLKSEHWEFYEKIIPAVGGSLFTLIAAWFKETTIKVIQNSWFQWGQIPLAIVALLLGGPVLPVHVSVLPAEGTALFVDKDDKEHSRDPKKAVWVSFSEHDVIAKHFDAAGPNVRTFHWSRRDLLSILSSKTAVELPVVYSVRLMLPEPGLTVNIRRVVKKAIGTKVLEMDSPFDEDFLNPYNILPLHMKATATQTVILTSVVAGDTSPVTKLPAGDYEVTSLKQGCKPSREVAITVPPGSEPENWTVSLQSPECPR